MSFTVHTVETAPDGSREHLALLQERIGFLPNLAASIGGAPAAIASFNAQQGALRTTTLTGAEREVVGVTVSLGNTCAYSMAAHSVFALGNGLPMEVLEPLRAGRELPDARLEALRVFTEELVRSRGHVGAADLAAARAAGFDDGQLLEIITQAAYTTFANWAANVGGAPVDAAFECMAWTAPASA